MASEVKLPQLGQTMEEGTIVDCKIKIGDEVKKGDVIFEIETDKATLEMESPATGFVKHIAVENGQTLPVGNLVCILGEKDEQVEISSSKSEPQPTSAETVGSDQPAVVSASPTAPVAPTSANVIKLPQLGQTMEEGTIVDCKIKVGDKVKKGDVIFEIETDKATLEMESPADGFVKYIFAETGQTLPVGDALLILGDKDEDVPQSFIDSAKAAVPTTQAPPTPAKTPPTPAEVVPTQPAKSTQKAKASPRAKKLAAELGIDLAAIIGTGPVGRITEDDVKNFKQTKPPAETVSEPKLGATIPMTKIQRLTAQRMLKSKREIPCFYLTVKVDMTALVELRIKLNGQGNVKIAYNDFLVKAFAASLEKFPIMTGQLEDDNICLADLINVGLAMSAPQGLIVPVVKEANSKDITAIANETNQLIEKARSNKLLLTDLEGACFTISNLGAFGIESFIPIVIPGQCSIVGIGRIADTLVPYDGDMSVRKLMSMTISVDHKVANGAYAAQFLNFVKEYLEETSNFI